MHDEGVRTAYHRARSRIAPVEIPIEACRPSASQSAPVSISRSAALRSGRAAGMDIVAVSRHGIPGPSRPSSLRSARPDVPADIRLRIRTPSTTRSTRRERSPTAEQRSAMRSRPGHPGGRGAARERPRNPKTMLDMPWVAISAVAHAGLRLFDGCSRRIVRPVDWNRRHQELYSTEAELQAPRAQRQVPVTASSRQPSRSRFLGSREPGFPRSIAEAVTCRRPVREPIITTAVAPPSNAPHPGASRAGRWFATRGARSSHSGRTRAGSGDSLSVLQNTSS
jgi:hypothetical protein